MLDGAIGLIVGYVALHPISMLIFAFFDPRLRHAGGGDHGFAAWRAVSHSFSPDMLPMGAVFAVFSAAIAAVDGYYRRALADERDQLALQLAANERLRISVESQAAALRLQNATLERLEEANRRHTQFMVHDFKGHLQVILGFAGILRQREAIAADSQAAEELQRIERQAARMNGAVLDLLDFARLRESPHLRREQVRPSDLLDRAAVDVTMPTHLGRVSLGPEHTACPEVMADARLVERVLVNLASNALKHNRFGTNVVLDASPAPDGLALVFSCSDDGQGLSVEAQASLFQAFSSRSAPAGSDSTGLGLAFCKAAVEAHGGRIWLDSPEGPGARFLFTVPLGAEGT
jgi:signal transduction histidine kinase